jgi:hypothetical protein
MCSRVQASALAGSLNLSFVRLGFSGAAIQARVERDA